MTREQLLEKSLESLREIAKAQGVKSITKYRKAELVEIIMNGGIVARNQPIFGAYIQLSQMPDPIAAAKAENPSATADMLDEQIINEIMNLFLSQFHSIKHQRSNSHWAYTARNRRNICVYHYFLFPWSYKNIRSMPVQKR